MLTQTIRRKFLEYFKNQQNTIVPSSPVIPHDDPTLLFINAGMNQFKDVFLGRSHRDYTRAASSQKCIRVGGKHNDLENVGHTSRHLTFFEMLGNFSFGDYFKEQAIRYSWEIATKIFEFDPDRIWPSVFRVDDEAFEIWTQYVPAERITRLDEKDNFWAMGDTGPCGPCSELYYDKGSGYGNARNPAEDAATGERFLEFWNLVFMQYNTLQSGQRENLPKPSIDTGAGLERVISIKMGVKSLFETDVLRSIIAQVESVTGIPYHIDDNRSPAFRVIADHLRCLAFAIADGVQPSNVDRGYVLRKVLRRSVRYGRQLGMDRPFLAEVLPQLVSAMGEDYPELVKAKDRIAEILTVEEEAFIRTLRRGGNILNQVIEKAQSAGQTITGDDAFKLKDTYGLPIEEVLLIAKDSDLHVDEKRYNELEAEAKERSRKVQKNVQQIASENVFADFAKQHGETEFLGFNQNQCESSVLGLVVDGEFVQLMEQGQEGIVILGKTPFYAEMGGQVGDTGFLQGKEQSFRVVDCVSPYKGVIGHQGKLDKGTLRVGDVLKAVIDAERRQKIANNHTATHLLHWALHRILGEHIKQAGSVVDPQRLRFDFSHHKALSTEEIRQIEDLVNAKIRENHPVEWYELKYEEAQKREDIKQFFGEKYGSTVRVIDIDYSKELCGGTHTSAVGTIGLFRIAKESSIAAGIRRIEAVTGHEAELMCRQSDDALAKLGQTLKSPVHLLEERVQKLLEENRLAAQELKALRKHQISTLIESLMSQTNQAGSLRFIVAEAPLSTEELQEAINLAMDRLGTGIVVLGTALPDKCHLMIKISDDCVKQGFSANDLIKIAMPIVEGSGGGKPQLAQGGGKLPAKLIDALERLKESILLKAKTN